MKSLAVLANSLSATNADTASYKAIMLVLKEPKFSFPNVVLKKAEASQLTLYNYKLERYNFQKNWSHIFIKKHHQLFSHSLSFFKDR